MTKTDSNATHDRQARIACIGLGMIGHVHAGIADQIEDCKLVAVSDTDLEKEKLAQAYHANFYTDYREMIENETLDGVIISLPNAFHEPVGSTCAERGLHIFMEKPVAPSIDEADRLIQTAAQNNVRLLVGHRRRFSPYVESARAMIQSSEIGRLVGVSAIWAVKKPAEYFVQGPWRKEKGDGGPVLINLIHEIDNLRYICGEIIRVYAEVSHKGRAFPVEDTVSITVRFEDDTVGTILICDCAPSICSYEASTRENLFFFQSHGNTYHFLGTKASLDFPHLNKVYYDDSGKVGWQHPVSIRKTGIAPADPLIRQLKHFCKVAIGKAEPRTSGPDGRQTLRVTLAVLESGATHQPVNISPWRVNSE